MNAITSSDRKMETMFSVNVPPFVACVPPLDKGRFRSPHELAAMIHWQWAQAGHEVQVWVDGEGNIQSNLVNGLPTRRGK